MNGINLAINKEGEGVRQVSQEQKTRLLSKEATECVTRGQPLERSCIACVTTSLSA